MVFDLLRDHLQLLLIDGPEVICYGKLDERHIRVTNGVVIGGSSFGRGGGILAKKVQAIPSQSDCIGLVEQISS